MIDFVDLFNACLYIQDNLDADLSLLFLAQTVGLSRFRFHRVFKAWRGETLHDFVTRMRMERAAFELSYPIPRSSRRSIKAIAFTSGYKSLSSFSHAFSSYSALSPREFRNRALRRRPDLSRSTKPMPSFGAFSISVTEQPEREIAVLDGAVPPCEGTTLSTLARSGAAAPVDGERFAVELLPNLLARSQLEAHVPQRVARLGCVGVEIDRWRESVRRSHGGRTSPRSSIRLDGGRYAVLEGEGSLSMLYRAWRRGFDEWLALSGECPKPGRLYLRFPQHGAEAPSRIALYVPLEDLPPSSSRLGRAHSRQATGMLPA